MYTTTGKDPDLSRTTELAHYLLSERIEDRFPEGAPTLQDIHTYVTRPMGLGRGESDGLVRRAIASGYIIRLPGRPTVDQSGVLGE